VWIAERKYGDSFANRTNLKGTGTSLSAKLQVKDSVPGEMPARSAFAKATGGPAKA
jgi:hypothetical protein